jgi:hypothetical protein
MMRRSDCAYWHSPVPNCFKSATAVAIESSPRIIVAGSLLVLCLVGYFGVGSEFRQVHLALELET